MEGGGMRKVVAAKKKVKGTQRGKRVKNTPAPPVTKIIGPPAELNKEAAAEWNAIAHLLNEESITTDLDKKMLMSYCNEMAKYWDYTAKLEAEDVLLELKDKKGNVVNYMKNPLCDLANKALDNATKIAAHFGLTPLSRSKIEIKDNKDADSPEKKAEEAFKNILKKKGNQVQMKTA